MQIDDLVMRIRRLSSAKRKKLDEMIRALEEGPQEVASMAINAGVPIL